MAILGAHMSISGGVDTAFDRGEQVGCDAMQIFTKSSNQWRAAPLTEETIIRYKLRQAETGIRPVVAHSSYLLNLASPDDALWQKSLDALVMELERCETLGIPYLVLHPGSHVGAGEAAGIERVARALDEAHVRLPGAAAKVALETTSGQGSNLGYTFDQLAAMIAGVKAEDRLVVCFDTCHALSAGYEFRTQEGYERTFADFDRILDLDRLRVFHINDSKFDLGSRKDRHEDIGKGFVGLETYRRLLNDPRFGSIPMLLETPKSEDMHEDIENLAVLRGLLAQPA